MKATNRFDLIIRQQFEKRGLTWLEDLEQVESCESGEAKKIVCLLLVFACQAQQAGMIMTARERLARLPGKWFRENIIACSKECLDLEDEWEFRRFLELLSIKDSSLIRPLAESRLVSPNEEVREAAEDFLGGETH